MNLLFICILIFIYNFNFTLFLIFVFSIDCFSCQLFLFLFHLNRLLSNQILRLARYQVNQQKVNFFHYIYFFYYFDNLFFIILIIFFSFTLNFSFCWRENNNKIHSKMIIVQPYVVLNWSNKIYFKLRNLNHKIFSKLFQFTFFCLF